MKRFFIALMLCFALVISPAAITYASSSYIQVNNGSEREENVALAWSNSGSVLDVTPLGIEATYNIADQYRNTGALPTSSNEFVVNLALTNVNDPVLSEIAFSRLFDSPTWGQNATLELGNDSGAFGVTESNGTYTVTDAVNGVNSITYTQTRLTIKVRANYVGDINIKYRANTSEGTTDFGNIVLHIENKGVYFVNGFNGVVAIEYDDINNHTYDLAFFKQFVAFGYYNGTTISKDNLEYGRLSDENDGEVTLDGVIDTTIYNVPQTVLVIYIDPESQEIAFSSGINVIFVKEEAIENTINIKINDTTITSSASNRYVINVSAGDEIKGTVTCSSGNSAWTLNIIGETYNFNLQSSFGEMEGEQFVEKSTFTITQYPYQVGDFDLTLVAEDTLTGFTKNIYLTIKVTSATPPTINLYSDSMQINKGDDITNIDNIFRDNIRDIVMYNGSSLDDEIISDSSVVIITCNITSSASGGSYNVTYRFTDTDTGLTGTATAVLEVVDTPPEILIVVARKEDDTRVDSGSSVPLGTTIVFTVNAVDENDDTITYFANSSRGTMVQDEDDETVFYFTPTNAMAGELTFTFGVSDGYSAGENYTYNITFLDDTPPTITFTNAVVKKGNNYYLDVSRKTQVWFRTYIYGVSDNSSTLSMNDVTITPHGFTFIEGGERFTFAQVGDYSVTYELADDSGNKTTINVIINVENELPTARDKSYEFGYKETAEIPLINLASDDTDGYMVVGFGLVTDEDGNSLVTDVFNFSDDGIVTLKLRPIYSESMGRDVPYIGPAYFSYKVIDSDGAFSLLTYTVTVNFIDNTAPVVTQTDKPTRFIRGRDYSDFTPYGYFTAVDDVDGVLTPASVVIYLTGHIVDEVSFDVNAEYGITYKFIDKAGNEVTRSVVITIASGGRPKLELLTTEATIIVGAKFDIYNFIYAIRDEEDGDKTSGFKALRENGSLNIDDGHVDTSKEGRYTIKMYYVDSDGNPSETISFILKVEKVKQFPMWIVYVGIAAVVIILVVIIVRVIIVKRRMRI